MELISTKEEHIGALVRISKAAFDSDVQVGATDTGGPPEYDNPEWHREMAEQGHLFTAIENGKISGGAILFLGGENHTCLFVGRIFIDPAEFRKGYGTAIMAAIEQLYPNVAVIDLDTPIWNIRTNRFYRKLGYCETRRDDESVYYRKEL